MKTAISSWLLIRLLLQPTAVFEELSETRPEPHSVFFKFVVWLDDTQIRLLIALLTRKSTQE